MIRQRDFTKLAAVLLAALLWCASPNMLAGSLEMELSCEPVGTGTPGYWMTHPEAWPVEVLAIGDGYTREQAIELMLQPTAGDKWLTLFPAVVAAKLNLLHGTESKCCIDGEVISVWHIVNLACWWLDHYEECRPVRASSDAWQDCGEPLYEILDAYNNGDLCAPSRDDLEDEIEVELSCEPVGTGTPGYWKNHPDAWPVEVLAIGDGYTKEEAIELMQQPTAGDKWLTLFQAAVAAKLNLLNGTESKCCIDGEVISIWHIVNLACWWLDHYEECRPVAASSDAWQDCGEPLYEILDAYNNGEMCAPSRDDLE
jgi:hypothetical protein